MRLFSIAVGLLGIALLPHPANAQGYFSGCTTMFCNDDPFNDYLQRSQNIAIGAGNANAVNEAIQTITPWPPHVGDRRIPLQGRQAADAIEQMYRYPNAFEQHGSGSAPPGSPASGTPGGSSPTGLPVTPMQPISSGGY